MIIKTASTWSGFFCKKNRVESVMNFVFVIIFTAEAFQKFRQKKGSSIIWLLLTAIRCNATFSSRWFSVIIFEAEALPKISPKNR